MEWNLTHLFLTFQRVGSTREISGRGEKDVGPPLTVGHTRPICLWGWLRVYTIHVINPRPDLGEDALFFLQ